MSWLTIVGGAISLSFFIILFTLFANLFTFPRLRPASGRKDAPLVSILVPARNEAQVIGGTVSRLLAQTYANFELVILDDNSTDGTAEAATNAANNDPRFRLVNGRSLPPGWLGKNWACHQLAEHAQGTYLLFVDADVIVQPDAVQATIAYAQRSSSDLLTVWPTQQTKTWGERLIVPLKSIAILAYLPVVMVHFTKWAAFAAANGQFLLFSRAGYKRSGGHVAVKNQIVEDVMLAKRIKAAGGTLRMLDGAGLVGCRMYTNWGEVRDGFAKNILAGHGSTTLLILSTIFHWLLFVVPWVWLVLAPGLWPLLLVVAGVGVRGITAVFTQQRLVDALFIPISVMLMTRIAIQSLIWQRKGNTQWKGRVVAT